MLVLQVSGPLHVGISTGVAGDVCGELNGDRRDAYESCCDIVRELLGYDGETGREEGSVPQGLHYPDEEGQHDEGTVAIHTVQESATRTTRLAAGICVLQTVRASDELSPLTRTELRMLPS